MDVEVDVGADADADADTDMTRRRIQGPIFGSENHVPRSPCDVLVSANVMSYFLTKIVLKIYENSCIPSYFYLCCIRSFFRS